MPVLSFGERKNRRLKSSGLSSSQTLSSFCQTVNMPSLRRASLITSVNGRRPPGAATTGGAPGGRRPEAAPPGPIAAVGADAAEPGPAAAGPLAVCKVVQPVSTAPAAARTASARPGEKRKKVGIREVLGEKGKRRVRW